jgi:hypothetical protein
MTTKITIIILVAIVLLSSVAFRQYTTQTASGSEAPEYTSDSQFKLPEHYRDWVYLTTGFDMSYNPAMSMGHHMFDNVFVNPESYKAFKETGTWPDKTVLLIEARGAESKGSINQAGNFQGTEVMAIEAHVKDESHFPSKWAFFGFDGDGVKTAKMIPASASCYTCHSQHAAVDTTFVQFYPTLLPIAKSKGTLSASYVKEKEAAQKEAASPSQKYK